MAVFPFSDAKKFLVGSLQNSLDGELCDAAEAIVNLHLEPQNFVMPWSVNYESIRKSLLEQGAGLRQHITFENTQTIQGICRVMVRTHLNRQGVSYVSRRELSNPDINRTQVQRVLGLFSGEFEPDLFLDWHSLLSKWITFGLESRRDSGDAIFSEMDIHSLKQLANLDSNRLSEAKRMKSIHNNWAKVVLGIHSGMNYLHSFYGLNADRVWERINEASQSPQGVRALMREAQLHVKEYGPALAGSFFADLGGKSFIKADVHVKDAIGAVFDIDSKKVADDFAFDVLQKTAEKYNVSPRAVDKVMYLAGSANLYLFNPPPTRKRQAEQKGRFISYLENFKLI